MEIGKAYLIETVDWFAFVGRVKRQVGPYEYEFTGVSKITDTNQGDVWHKLASGDKEARKKASYLHYADGDEETDGPILGRGVVFITGWRGKTPQEEGHPELRGVE